MTQHWLTGGIDATVLTELTNELPASTLWSLLLGVMEQRARRTPATLVDAFCEHIRVHLAALDRLAELGYLCAEYRVRLLSIQARAALAQRIAAALQPLEVMHEALTKNYYDGLRFMIDVRAPHGAFIPLSDGGAFDWLAHLAANRKLVFVASGMGSQVLAMAFRKGSVMD